MVSQAQQPQRAVRPQRQVMTRQIELTDAQREEMKAITERHREAAAESRAALIQARADLDALRVGTDPDLRELERAMNALSQLENAAKIQALRNRTEMMGVLTDEQKAQLGRTALYAGVMGRAGMAGRRNAVGRGMGRFHQGRAGGRGRGVGSGRGWNTPGRNWRAVPGGVYDQGRLFRNRIVPPGDESGVMMQEMFRDRFGARDAVGERMLRGRGRAAAPPPATTPPPPAE
jgi:Spy/CpxP family protein refolding chaperone